MTKFYKAKITVTVVADEPIDFENLADLNRQITDGDWLGNYKITEHRVINKEEAKKLCVEFQADPEFLGIEE